MKIIYFCDVGSWQFHLMCVFFFLIQRRLGVKSGGASVYHKTNRESMVEIGDSIRGKDIYIIQTGAKYVYILNKFLTFFHLMLCQILTPNIFLLLFYILCSEM